MFNLIKKFFVSAPVAPEPTPEPTPEPEPMPDLVMCMYIWHLSRTSNKHGLPLAEALASRTQWSRIELERIAPKRTNKYLHESHQWLNVCYLRDVDPSNIPSDIIEGMMKEIENSFTSVIFL